MQDRPESSFFQHPYFPKAYLILAPIPCVRSRTAFFCTLFFPSFPSKFFLTVYCFSLDFLLPVFLYDFLDILFLS